MMGLTIWFLSWAKLFFWTELNQIFCHHATTYQEALVQALLDQDMTTVTTATMAKNHPFCTQIPGCFVDALSFSTPSINPFIASSACKVKYKPGNQQCRTTLQLRTSCAGVLHCRSLPIYFKQPYLLNHSFNLIHLYINLKITEWSTK